jgi:hypothetical protein
MFCIYYTSADIYNQINIFFYSRFVASLVQSHVLSSSLLLSSSSSLYVSSCCFQGHTRARNYSYFFFNNAPCRKIQRWCSSQCTYKTYIHIFICILKQKSIYNLLFYPTWVEKKMRGWVKWNKCYSSEYYYTWVKKTRGLTERKREEIERVILIRIWYY